MTVTETFIEGLKILSPKVLEDTRGSFFKTYHIENFEELGLPTVWREEYFSMSNKDVVRGMHFQTPPDDHDKVVTCVQGAVLDVVLDLRKASKTYKQVFSLELNAQNRHILVIPKGCAHGFLSLQDNSMMFYKVSTVYSPANDKGLLWSSIGFDWPVANALVSERDQNHPTLTVYESPF